MTELSSPTLPPDGRTIRILSYNVHSCVGTDRRLDVGRVADMIAALEPDIIGLQELDVGRRRSGGVDQAEEIARRLKMEFHFHPALKLEEELYGDALLTPFPMRLVKSAALPSIGEPRGALWTVVDVAGTPLQVFNTHLGLLRRDRLRQAAALTGPDWLGHPELEGKPVVLIGDFNSIPSSAAYRLILERLSDARHQTGRLPAPTFPARWPLLRLDHVFVGGGPKIINAEAVSTPAARRASDHLPLLVTVQL